MVECLPRDESLDRVFHALADNTRRSILSLLVKTEMSVGEIVGHFPISFAAISKHLKVLDGAALIQRRRAGKSQMISLNAVGMRPAEQWLRYYETFWTQRFDAFENYLKGEKE